MVSHKKYPVDSLNIGDSFFVPFNDLNENNRGKSIRSVVTRYSKNTGRKFKVSIVEDGVRVWRIK